LASYGTRRLTSRLDALIDFIGLAAVFANRRNNQLTHALGLALRLASPAEPAIFRVVARASALPIAVRTASASCGGQSETISATAGHPIYQFNSLRNLS
jgi:hypothetical protein